MGGIEPGSQRRKLATTSHPASEKEPEKLSSSSGEHPRPSNKYQAASIVVLPAFWGPMIASTIGLLRPAMKPRSVSPSTPPDQGIDTASGDGRPSCFVGEPASSIGHSEWSRWPRLHVVAGQKHVCRTHSAMTSNSSVSVSWRSAVSERRLLQWPGPPEIRETSKRPNPARQALCPL